MALLAATDSAAACPTSSGNSAVEDKFEAADVGSSSNAQIRPSAQSTATGFVSPLTIMKNDQRSSNQPSGVLDRYSMITAPQIDAAYSLKIDQAREKTKRSFDQSKLLETVECVFPRFGIHELTLGKILGQGGFGTVLEIKAIGIVPPPQDDIGEKDEKLAFGINEYEEKHNPRKAMLRRGEGQRHLIKSRSHDGCEGAMGNHDRGIQFSKSHDCIGGDIHGEIVGSLDNAVHITANRITAGVKGGIQLGRDAFRMGHKHHEGMMVHPEKDKNATKQSQYVLEKSASYDEFRMRSEDGFTGVNSFEPGRASQPSHKVSCNFSFLAWRESMSGEEGNDVVSRNKIKNGSHEDCSEPAEKDSKPKALYQDEQFITQHITCKTEACFVIKLISQSIVENDFQKFLQAAKDLATETYFLSMLNHPHILKLRAVGQGDMFSPNFFLVLDRLQDTLFNKIERSWKTQLHDLENSIFVWDRATKLRNLWGERMRVMKDLAGALSYLHDLKIIYRDLKPENVGFDFNGNVKLFDFGLAREVHDDDDCGNGTYKLTPSTGSLRYMAPENANKWPYNFLADSYSFGILLWEVAALEQPYNSFTPKEIRDMVIKWGERPKTKDGWSERVVELMKSSWDSNVRKRPTMKVIEAMLEKELENS